MRKREYMEDDTYVTPQKYLDMSLEKIRAKLERRLKKYTKYPDDNMPLVIEKI